MAFDLQSISRTKRNRPPKIVICGVAKIGKTTFAASAPDSIGLVTEDGQDAVDALAFPKANSLSDIYEAIGTLLNGDHPFRWVWLDSLDWLEPLVWQHVCAANNWKNIEQPGYGKGYAAAADEWRNLLAGLEALRVQRNMGVVLICHDKIKHFESPLDEGYDRYTLKLHDRASELVKEWADIIGHANYDTYTRKIETVDKTKEAKAGTTGQRLLHLEPHPAHMGGNRFGLKTQPLDWNTFAAQLAAIQAPPAQA